MFYKLEYEEVKAKLKIYKDSIINKDKEIKTDKKEIKENINIFDEKFKKLIEEVNVKMLSYINKMELYEKGFKVLNNHIQKSENIRNEILEKREKEKQSLKIETIEDTKIPEYTDATEQDIPITEYSAKPKQNNTEIEETKEVVQRIESINTINQSNESYDTDNNNQKLDQSWLAKIFLTEKDLNKLNIVNQ